MPRPNGNKVVKVIELLKLYDEAVTRLPTWKLRRWVIAAVRPTAYASNHLELDEWITQLRTDMGKG